MIGHRMFNRHKMGRVAATEAIGNIQGAVGEGDSFFCFSLKA